MQHFNDCAALASFCRFMPPHPAYHQQIHAYARLSIRMIQIKLLYIKLSSLFCRFPSPPTPATHRLKPILKPTDPIAALLSWICIVAINQYFVLPRNIGSTSAFSSLGQVSTTAVANCHSHASPHQHQLSIAF